MAAINPADIRNLTIIGNAGSGKTTLIERLLLTAGAITRMGTVEEGNTVSDYTDDSKKHKHTLMVTPVRFTHNGKHITLLDTPGLTDFFGHAIASFPAVETAMVVVDAARGVESTGQRLMKIAADRKLPRMIVVNKSDSPEVDLAGLVAQIQEAFGRECLPVNLPSGNGATVVDVFEHEHGSSTDFSSVEEAHTKIVEQVVEVNEDLMAEYLEGGKLDPAKVSAVFTEAMRQGHLVPVCFVSSRTGAGASDLLDLIALRCPSPVTGNPRPFLMKDAEGNEAPITVKPDPSAHLVAHVFKVMADPFVGKLGVFRVHQGTVKSKDDVYINDDRRALRIGHMFRLHGKEHTEIHEAGPGEIAAVSKLDDIRFNGVLHVSGESIRLAPLPLPKPMYGLAIELKNHADEGKFGTAIAKLIEEDPCLVMERIAATKQTVLRGLGELHLRVVMERLKNQYGIELLTSPPKVAYKETITAKAEGHHRHKKQTGGAGQFGEVYMRIEPLPADHPEGFEFVSEVVGGTVPRQYWPAVEKGVRQVLTEGAIAGYPLTGVRVALYDGKYHDVDSKEIAFVTAGRKAFIDAVGKAKPKLLEPYVLLEVTAPATYMGSIAGDISTKRGRVQDTQMVGADTCLVRAVAPLGELQNYSSELKSMTGGAGTYSMDYSHDEHTPPHIQQAVVAAYKPRADEE